ncbi:MAG: DUF192 domain-containing protein [Chloroflexota bacterium]
MARQRTALRLLDPASGRELASSIEVPRTSFGRGLGLMFRRELPAGHAMWIKPCNGIHMFWMNFAIDALFLDRAERVVKVYRRLGRWRVVPLVWRAHSVVELPAGGLDGFELERGHQLEFAPVDAGRPPFPGKVGNPGPG